MMNIKKIDGFKTSNKTNSVIMTWLSKNIVVTVSLSGLKKSGIIQINGGFLELKSLAFCFTDSEGSAKKWIKACKEKLPSKYVSKCQFRNNKSSSDSLCFETFDSSMEILIKDPPRTMNISGGFVAIGLRLLKNLVQRSLEMGIQETELQMSEEAYNKWKCQKKAHAKHCPPTKPRVEPPKRTVGMKRARPAPTCDEDIIDVPPRSVRRVASPEHADHRQDAAGPPDASQSFAVARLGYNDFNPVLASQFIGIPVTEVMKMHMDAYMKLKEFGLKEKKQDEELKIQQSKQEEELKLQQKKQQDDLDFQKEVEHKQEARKLRQEERAEDQRQKDNAAARRAEKRQQNLDMLEKDEKRQRMASELQEQERLQQKHEFDMKKHQDDQEAELAERKAEAERKSRQQEIDYELEKLRITSARDVKMENAKQAASARRAHRPRRVTPVDLHLKPAVEFLAVKEYFGNSLERYCGECNATVITMADFHVSLGKDHERPPVLGDVHIACKDCHDETLGGSVHRLMPEDRVRVWVTHQGFAVSGPCHACMQPLHFYENFHKSHDEAFALGGSSVDTNIRPAHAACNRKMGILSFAQYRRQLRLPTPAKPRRVTTHVVKMVTNLLRKMSRRRNCRRRPRAMGPAPVPVGQPRLGGSGRS